MPTILRLYCEVCDANSDAAVTWDGFAGVSLFNCDGRGKLTSEGYLAYLDSHGKLVPLPHPLEDASLKEQGDTWNRASWDGRLFHVKNVICNQCGTINRSPELNCFTGAGCNLGIALAVVTFIVLKLLTSVFFPILIVASVFLIGIPEWVISKWLKHRYRERIAQLAFRECNCCGSPCAISLHNCIGKSLVCAKCRNKTLRITIAGMS